MTLLVVGLGNPGRQYESTRHNIGFMVLEELLGTSMWKSKFKGEYIKTIDADKEIIYLRPMTYMNLSGESIKAAMDFFKVETSNLLVIHDELDLPFATLTLKKGGGFAGHNGLKSTGQHLGTQDFLRLRMGIGRPVHGDVSHFVLSSFSDEEHLRLSSFIKGGLDAMKSFIHDGFAKAANLYNKKNYL